MSERNIIPITYSSCSSVESKIDLDRFAIAGVKIEARTLVAACSGVDRGRLLVFINEVYVLVSVSVSAMLVSMRQKKYRSSFYS